MAITSFIENPARQQALEAFLQQAGWGEATTTFLAGDASFRRYYRAQKGTTQAVIMDAPPQQENIRPFVAMTEYLHAIKLHPPAILAEDMHQGFLLLEDLGDGLLNPLLAQQPAQEHALYQLAIDALLHLHQQRAADFLAPYDWPILKREVGLFLKWYLPARGITLPRGAEDDFYTFWEEACASLHYPANVTVLRDYHADNLLLLPHEKGLKSLGLLDYQDALLGSPAYDLASLLEDARRAVSPQLAQQMLDYYHQHSHFEATKLMHDYAILAAQRNVKILGIFARLAARDNKPHYLDYLPRVWRYTQTDIARAPLKPLQAWFDMYVPVEKRGI